VKVAVVGLWHLGCVTAAALTSAGHEVIGLDFDSDLIERLREGRAPVAEPGLDEWLRAGIDAQRLQFTADAARVAGCSVVWITYDTPVDDDDRADVAFVLERTASLMPHLSDGTLLLVSSQVPVGTTGQIESRIREMRPQSRISVGYSPENLRLGQALQAFTKPDRVIVGLRDVGDRARVEALLGAFTSRFEWMQVESAEMTKHALNAFLATSVAFINEVAALCETVGADAAEVERGLKTEARIGPQAYLSPGAAFAGGTLARDIVFLIGLGQARDVPSELLTAVKRSNDVHKEWPRRRLKTVIGDLGGRSIAIWGLTYKPGTDTLRRSSAVELALWLSSQNARVRAHDPALAAVPRELADTLDLSDSALHAVEGADALVVATPCPEFRRIDPFAVASLMRRPLVLDAGGFLRASLGSIPEITYLTVGRSRS
jgi:UDPglucose 6-dehydrogenase